MLRNLWKGVPCVLYTGLIKRACCIPRVVKSWWQPIYRSNALPPPMSGQSASPYYIFPLSRCTFALSFDFRNVSAVRRGFVSLRRQWVDPNLFARLWYRNYIFFLPLIDTPLSCGLNCTSFALSVPTGNWTLGESHLFQNNHRLKSVNSVTGFLLPIYLPI